MKKFDVRALSLTLGILSGACVFLTGLAATYLGVGSSVVELVSEYYIGFEATLSGSFVGGIFGFIDGAIVGLLLGWLYNWLSKK